MKAIHTLRALVIASFAAVTATGCSSPDYDEYYIKYTVGITPGDTVNIHYNDVYHSFHDITGVEKGETVEATLGPVYGGFRASIDATVNGGDSPRFIQIDMSKNGAPYRTMEYVERGKTAVWEVPITK